MNEVLLGVQIGVAILLSAAILIQVKGTGFGRAWGGASGSFTRRGVESLVFKLTFVLSGLFILVSVLALVS